MSSDLDDLLRASLRRHAEDAPTAVDLDLVRTRSRTLARRRRVTTAAGTVAAVAVAGTVVLAVGTAHLSPAPPPVTDVTPTADASPVPDPTPSVTNAVSPSPDPSPSSTSSSTLPPAPAVAPWTATVTDAGGAPPTAGITVRAAGRTTLVDHQYAQAWIAGWTGPGRRTLVYGFSQDSAIDEQLRAATFDTDGRLVDGPRDLAVRGGAGLVGRAFVLPDGRLAVAEFLRDAAPAEHERLLRFSVDLAQAAPQDLPSSQEVLAVTGDGVVLAQRSTSQTPAREITISAVGPTATRTWTIAACPYTDTVGQPPTPRASLASDGSSVALWCWASDAPVTVLPLAGPTMTAASVASPPVPGSGFGSESAAWFDADGALAVTLTPGAAWRYSLSRTWSWLPVGALWHTVQPVLARTYVDGYAVTATTTGAETGIGAAVLSTGTDPSLTLGTVDLMFAAEGQAFAVRPSG